MARKQKTILNKTRNIFWRAAYCLWQIEDGHSCWEGTVDKATKFSMSSLDADALQVILTSLAKGFPDNEFEIRTFEVIPKQFKEVY